MMNFRDYNDYEILDSIRQGNEEALALMIEKYRFLIAKKIKKFNLTNEFDDCFQEGLIVLYRSIKKFDDRFSKTFTRYFETNLEHRLISIIRQNQQTYRFLNEKLNLISESLTCPAYEDNGKEQDIKQMILELSPLEKQVFEHRFLRSKSIVDVAMDLKIPTKRVYNAVDRIREKLNMQLRT
jgi:RNA polymerase sporulation-specific sigma factor